MFIFIILEGSGPSLFILSLEASIHFTGLLFLSGVVAFLVKFPVFGVHIWLPKAHVEAPVSGSIILAGVLLKLGGYGMLRLSPTLSAGDPFFFLIVVVLRGARIIRVVCISTRDMKIVIALSSVVHMALIVVVFK